MKISEKFNNKNPFVKALHINFGFVGLMFKVN